MCWYFWKEIRKYLRSNFDQVPHLYFVLDARPETQILTWLYYLYLGMYFVVLVIYVTWPTVLTYFQAEIGNSSQKCRKRGLGGFQFSTDQLKPYSNQEADYAHHITNPPPWFSDCAASLLTIRNSTLYSAFWTGRSSYWFF